ncbi:MAG: DUF721 domain-containing protein [Candidatus Korobacteraceae bacterium]
MRHAGTTLRKIFRDTISREPDNAVMLAWPLACGAKTAERTNAVAFAEGVLTILVPDETWRYQLQSLSPQYLAALNQFTPQPVSRINFVPVNKLEHR